ncbi:hypothetical protein HD554DRAFT_2041425 [Boletus coccyginus]|nr:hypothetical protein HD554DRAFT_2041425 [Boletus coccyginus]
MSTSPSLKPICTAATPLCVVLPSDGLAPDRSSDGNSLYDLIIRRAGYYIKSPSKKFITFGKQCPLLKGPASIPTDIATYDSRDVTHTAGLSSSKIHVGSGNKLAKGRRIPPKASMGEPRNKEGFLVGAMSAPATGSKSHKVVRMADSMTNEQTWPTEEEMAGTTTREKVMEVWRASV